MPLDAAVTHDPPIFSRNLMVLGLVIGTLHLAAMFMAPALFGREAAVSAPHVLPLAAGSALEAACGEAGGTPGNTITTSYGDAVEYFLVIPAETIGDAVMAITSLVDAAVLYRCEGLVPVETGMMAGDSLPFSVRPLKRLELAFPVGEVTASDRFVLAITQNALISTDVYLQDRADFERALQRRLTVRLFLLGAVSGLILYNTVLSFVARNRTFLFNALTISSMLLLDIYLSGIGAAYLWPEQPWLSNVVLGFALSGPALFAPFYLYSFLENRPFSAIRRSPLYWLWPAAALAGLVAMLVVPLWPVYLFHTALWIVLALVFAVVLLRRTRSGNERAAILTVPVLGAILPAMIIGIMKEFVGYDFGVVGPHATEIVLMAEALLFTFALAYMLRLSEFREHAALETANRMSRSINARLMQTLDSERTRVASELHDTAGQGVVLIVNQLKALSANRRLDTGLRADVARTEHLARDMLAEIRGISHSLHPAVLDHLGFEQAAVTLAQNLAKANAQEIAIDFPEERMPLTKNQALQLYRIVQELLSNALKHAGATTIRLALAADGEKRVLSVSDDGQGLPGDAGIAGRTGVGMRILAQRVASLPGAMEVQSDATGTWISVCFVPGVAADDGNEDGSRP